MTSAVWATSLQNLELAGCNASLTIPAGWALIELNHLDLSNNAIDGDLGFIAAPRLEYLDVAGNHLAGNLSAVAWEMAPSLQVLRLSNNIGIQGSLPSGKFAMATVWWGNQVFILGLHSLAAVLAVAGLYARAIRVAALCNRWQAILLPSPCLH